MEIFTIHHTDRKKLSSGKLDSIQALRGIAALIVTVYHLKDVVGPDDAFKRELDLLFNGGPAGVSLFFIISGFIMVYITHDPSSRDQRLGRFLVKRFVRIWPTYAIWTLLYYYLHHRLQGNTNDVTMLLKSLAFLPLSPTDPPFYGYATLSVGWSLNYEIYFYAVVGCSMLFAHLRWYVFFAWMLLTLVALPLALGFFTMQPTHASDFGWTYMNMVTNPVIWNFVIGAAIGLAYIQPGIQTTLEQFFIKKWILAAAVTLGVWQYLSGFFGGLGPLQWGAGAALMLTATLFYSERKNVVFPTWLVWLGDVSFSIYLLHLPVIVGMSQLFHRLGYPIYSSGTPALFLAVAITLIASHFSHIYLEIRLSGFLKRILLPQG